MRRFYKELDNHDNVIGVCSSSYSEKEQIEWFNKKGIKAIEITEKEYNILHRNLGSK